MKYTRELIQKQYAQGKPFKFLFFWGHKPQADGRITKAALSQWWPSDFVLDSTRYFCMEQYMMAAKARVFGDSEIQAGIMKSRDPREIKAFGRQVRGFDGAVWEANRSEIVISGNVAKFTQDERLKEYLLSTKDKILVEASPYDIIWGIGLAEDDVKSKNPLAWKGLNLLGFALMEVRDQII
ncbi:hypothetical protein FACS1894200_14390 [Spirochaetia bacterium]|nr:hypothetical protein FACS1894200_14390 [Spirochaetia bacterium]